MRFLRTVSAVAVGVTLVGPARFASAADEPRTSVLGLGGVPDADDELNVMVARAVAKQASTLVEGPSLPELRLALDCGSNEPQCLAQAKSMLDVDELVYGELEDNGDGQVMLRLWRLDVQAGSLLGSAALPVSGKKTAALERDIDRMVVVLFEELPEDEDALIAGPLENGGDDRAGTDPEPAPGPTTLESTSSTTPDDGRRWEWGTYNPKPWKLAGVGASGGVAVVGVVMWATAAGLLRDRGRIRTDLLEAVADSTADDDPLNDIDPNSADVCGDGEDAGYTPVVDVCRRATRTRGVGLAGLGLLGVGVVGAITFTSLLFVRRRQPRREAVVRPFFWSGHRSTGGGVGGRF